MPTASSRSRLLIVRRVAEPSRDQHLFLAQAYDALLHTPPEPTHITQLPDSSLPDAAVSSFPLVALENQS
jgi:hypothetical protein